MSEAQYVCTGQEGETDLSHYGLGLQKYTHFTSPIRRYADVVVHKQLLETPRHGRAAEKYSSQSLPRQGLKSIPTSDTISILQGQGLVEQTSTDELTKPQLSKDTGKTQLDQGSDSLDSSEALDVFPYKGQEVTKICKGLNHQNRMAKVSSELATSSCSAMSITNVLRPAFII